MVTKTECQVEISGRKMLSLFLASVIFQQHLATGDIPFADVLVRLKNGDVKANKVQSNQIT